MTKTTLILALSAAALFGVPRPVAAAGPDCTIEYARCLSDNAFVEGALQSIADIECAAELTACTIGKLRFW